MHTGVDANYVFCTYLHFNVYTFTSLFSPRARNDRAGNDPLARQCFPALYFSRLKQIKIICLLRETDIYIHIRMRVQIAFVNYRYLEGTRCET